MRFKAIILITLIVTSFLSYTDSHFLMALEIKGPNSDNLVFLSYYDELEAITALSKGGAKNGIDLYLYPISSWRVEYLKNMGLSSVIDYKGKIFSILFNPAPSDSSFFNILYYKEIRNAMNLLFSRSYLKDEILKGYADIIYSPISESDPDFIYVADILAKYSENATIAKSKINNFLLKLGAKKENNTWVLNGSAIEMKLALREDDEERFQYGLFLADLLKDLGFSVKVIPVNASLTATMIYGSDPRLFNWSIYIESWDFGDFFSYSDFIIAQMYSPWYGYMPGWNNPDFWNYSNSTIDKITKKLLASDYSGMEERVSLLRKALAIGLEESVRIFLVQKHNVYAYNPYRITFLINSYYLGLSNKFNLVNIKPSVEPKEPVKIGVKTFYLDTLNPIGGNKAPTYKLIYSLVSDQPFLRDPHSGKIKEFRVKYRVLNASQYLDIQVPSNAIYWDSINNRWSYVGLEAKARSAIEYSINYTKWQDGSRMNIYDILYWFYFLWEWSSKINEDDVRYSVYIQADYYPFISKIKGIEIRNDTTLVLYTDFYSFDHAELAYILPPWTTIPWQLLFALERLYLNNEISWFLEEAKARNNIWLNLAEEEQATKINLVINNLVSNKIVPEPLREGVILPISLQESLSRYENSTNFINERKNSLISNGPFVLSYYLKDILLVLSANREYDLSPLYFEVPKEPKLKINVEYNRVVYIGDNVTITSKIYLDDKLAGQEDAKLYYWVYDENRKLIIKGIAEYFQENFLISFSTNKWKPGYYYLDLYVYSSYSIIPLSYKSYLIVSSRIEQNNTTTNTPLTTITIPTLPTFTTSPETTSIVTTMPQQSWNLVDIIILLLLILVVFSIYFAIRSRELLKSLKTKRSK